MPQTSPDWQRAFPVNTMGTPELGFFVVDMGEDIETNYSLSDSLYAQAVRALQKTTDLYMVGLPDGNFFTFSARISSIPGAVAGLSLIHISEPTRQAEISYAVFCLSLIHI